MGVQNPSAILEQLSDGMTQALQLARRHGSIKPALHQKIVAVWDEARRGY